MSDTVECCPDCDGTHFQFRVGGHNSSKPGPKFRCYDCGAAFDGPGERERRNEADTLQGLAGKLDEMDPADLGGGSA